MEVEGGERKGQRKIRLTQNAAGCGDLAFHFKRRDNGLCEETSLWENMTAACNCCSARLFSAVVKFFFAQLLLQSLGQFAEKAFSRCISRNNVRRPVSLAMQLSSDGLDSARIGSSRQKFLQRQGCLAKAMYGFSCAAIFHRPTITCFFNGTQNLKKGHFSRTADLFDGTK